MRKNLKILPILFVMPCLMANAIGPSNYYSNYTSLRVEYVSSTQISEEEYQHTYHLNNYGDGYIDRLVIGDSDDEGKYNSTVLNFDNISDLFANALYQPGYGDDVTITCKYPLVNTSHVLYSAQAYKPGSSSSLTQLKGIKYVRLNTNEYSNFKYIYEVEFQISSNRDALFHLDYDGHDYYITSRTSGGYEHNIYVAQELDLEKLSVKSFFFIEPHQAFKVDEDALTRAMYIFIAGFLLLASLIVFPAVFIPAMVRRSRRRKAKAAKK